MKKPVEYYLGLDLGTSSVGWAVTNERYEILRAKGKDLWGVREFEEASTAEKRRTNRVSRRRRERERARIGLLKGYFHDAIAAVDPCFYTRLDYSKYFQEDRPEEVQTRNTIFQDVNYNDADYYKEYPTIFHLRKELMENSAEHDVRLVYLAVLNMFKHRGHFLNAGLSGEGETKKVAEVYQELYELVEQLPEDEMLALPAVVDFEKMEEILSSRELSRTRKVEALAELFGFEKKRKRELLFLKAICGLKVNAKDFFLLEDEEEKVEFDFSSGADEEKLAEVMTKIGEEHVPMFEVLKEIYDIGVLAGIMRGYSYLSEARVASYEKHKADLQRLKEVYRTYLSDTEYERMFRSTEKATYSAYVKSVNTKISSGTSSVIRRNMDKCKLEDLYKTIKTDLKKIPENEQTRYILQEIEKESFLPKQLTASNGVIPNQVHARELHKILENAEAYLPFLKDVDESGLTVSERITKLFSFQIPYYIGPVKEESKTGWVVRKEKGQVLPWNIEQKIDVQATSEAFIENLIRECTYLSGEKVLPKASLEYEAFCVLNEINNLRIDQEKISVELKQEIYKELFQKGKKVTRKQLVKFLYGKGVLKEDAQLSGIDLTINNSLSTYGKFKAILGDFIEEDAGRKMVEDLVRWCTIYGDAKKLLKERIQQKYSNQLTTEQQKRILGFKFKDWGRFSKEFLELQGCDQTTGEAVSLIRALWESNENLMELLHSNRYTFGEELEDKQKRELGILSDATYEDLAECYFSAPVRRMVWQTILIIKELEKVLGAPPKRIFLEMTRTDEEKGDKGRKDSRKKQLLELYKNIKDGSRNWKEEIEKADADGSLRQKKLYLYYTQMGRDMYTGKEIDLYTLLHDNRYDVDHIYPRHFVKDDSIHNNLVLVDKSINNRKQDIYPIDSAIRENQQVREHWKYLLEKGLILPEKYRRLTGKEPFTEEQQAGFIARQLVETSQGTKGVADLLKQLLPDTELVYSKASNVSEFRHKRNMLKTRLINDFHHAQDAYLNIVVGNVYYVKFTKNPMHFIRNEYGQDAKKFKYNLNRMFDFDVKRGNEVAWLADPTDEEVGTIVTVRKMMKKNTPLLTRMNFVGHGEIANATLYSASKAKPEGYIPLKSSDPAMCDVTKYGGYSSVSTGYFFLVEHEVKGKKIRTLEILPVYRMKEVDEDPERLVHYCISELRLVNPSIRVAKIRMQSLLKKDGYYVHISGKTGNRLVVRNAVSLCLEQKWVDYIRLCEKYKDKTILDLDITKEKNILLYQLLLTKHQDKIYQNRPGGLGNTLKKLEPQFEKSKLEDQCLALLQIIQGTRIGVAVSNLTLIGGVANAGVILINKDLTKAKECLLIHQSVTGLFETQIDLLTV